MIRLTVGRRHRELAHFSGRARMVVPTKEARGRLTLAPFLFWSSCATRAVAWPARVVARRPVIPIPHLQRVAGLRNSLDCSLPAGLPRC